MAPRHGEYHFWSLALGDHACRLSVTGREGREFWTIIPRPSHGREWREARAAAVEALCAAADSGWEPGEVLVGDAVAYPPSPHEKQARREARPVTDRIPSNSTEAVCAARELWFGRRRRAPVRR